MTEPKGPRPLSPSPPRPPVPATSEVRRRARRRYQARVGLAFGLLLFNILLLAGEIEAAAGRGEDVAGPAERLREVVAATRTELRAAVLLGEPRTVGA